MPWLAVQESARQRSFCGCLTLGRPGSSIDRASFPSGTDSAVGTGLPAYEKYARQPMLTGFSRACRGCCPGRPCQISFFPFCNQCLTHVRHGRSVLPAKSFRSKEDHQDRQLRRLFPGGVPPLRLFPQRTEIRICRFNRFIMEKILFPYSGKIKKHGSGQAIIRRQGQVRTAWSLLLLRFCPSQTPPARNAVKCAA